MDGGALDLLRAEMRLLWGDDRRPTRADAPELVMSVAADGVAVAVHADVPDTAAERVRERAARGAPPVPGEPPALPPHLRELLGDDAGALRWSGGPSYLAAPPAPPSAPPGDRAPRIAGPGVRVLCSAAADAARVRDARPVSWEPGEWAELVAGGAGAPWAMVVAERRVAAICHTPVRAASGAEAGTWTDPGFRGRGYAAAATAAWARLFPDGMPLFYSTSADNRSSRAVARRLGLRELGWMWKLARPRP